MITTEQSAAETMAVARRLRLRGYWVDRGTLGDWLDRLDAGWPDRQRGYHAELDHLRRDITLLAGWPELAAEHPVFRHTAPWEGPGLPRMIVPMPATHFERVAAAVGSAALLPLLRSIATQAGNHAYPAARTALRALVRDRPLPAGADCRLVVHEDRTGLSLMVPPALPDAALHALTRIDLTALAARPADGTSVVIVWDADAAEWRRLTRTAGHRQP